MVGAGFFRSFLEKACLGERQAPVGSKGCVDAKRPWSGKVPGKYGPHRELFLLIQKDPAKGSETLSLFNSADIRHLSFSADVL